MMHSNTGNYHLPFEGSLPTWSCHVSREGGRDDTHLRVPHQAQCCACCTEESHSVFTEMGGFCFHFVAACNTTRNTYF